MDDLLTTQEAAARLGISRRRVIALITDGKLRARRIGEGKRAVYLIDPEDLEHVRDRKPGRPAGKAKAGEADGPRV